MVLCLQTPQGRCRLDLQLFLRAEAQKRNSSRRAAHVPLAQRGAPKKKTAWRKFFVLRMTDGIDYTKMILVKCCLIWFFRTVVSFWRHPEPHLPQPPVSITQLVAQASERALEKILRSPTLNWHACQTWQPTVADSKKRMLRRAQCRPRRVLVAHTMAYRSTSEAFDSSLDYASALGSNVCRVFWLSVFGSVCCQARRFAELSG